MVKLMILSKTDGADAPGAKVDSGAAAAANDRSIVPLLDAVRIIRPKVNRNDMLIFLRMLFCSVSQELLT